MGNSFEWDGMVWLPNIGEIAWNGGISFWKKIMHVNAWHKQGRCRCFPLLIYIFESQKKNIYIYIGENSQEPFAEPKQRMMCCWVAAVLAPVRSSKMQPIPYDEWSEAPHADLSSDWETAWQQSNWHFCVWYLVGFDLDNSARCAIWIHLDCLRWSSYVHCRVERIGAAPRTWTYCPPTRLHMVAEHSHWGHVWCDRWTWLMDIDFEMALTCWRT